MLSLRVWLTRRLVGLLDDVRHGDVLPALHLLADPLAVGDLSWPRTALNDQNYRAAANCIKLLFTNNKYNWDIGNFEVFNDLLSFKFINKSYVVPGKDAI